MKRALVVAIAMTSLFSAAPAVAEDLDASSQLGDCTVTLLSLKRVNRDDPDDRYARARVSVNCTQPAYSGGMGLQVWGIKTDGTNGDSRDYKTARLLGSPIPAGEQIIQRRFRCNWLSRGSWEYDRRPLLLAVWTHIKQDGNLYRATTSERTSVRC